MKELVDAGFVKPKKAGRTSKLFLTEKFHRYFEKLDAAVSTAAVQGAEPETIEIASQTTL